MSALLDHIIRSHMSFALGGKVPNYDGGGTVDPNTQGAPQASTGGSGLFGSLSNVNAGWALPQSQFQGQSAGAGTGTTQLNESGAFQPGIGAAYGQEAQTFGGETGLGSTLTNEINGGGPNLANTQLQAGTAQNVNEVAGQLASQRGVNPALAQYQASTNQALANQSSAGQAAALRQQQQLAAQGQQASLLAQQGQQSNNLLGNSAYGNQGQNTLNLSNLMQTQGLNQQTSAQNAQLLQNAQAQNEGIQQQGGNAIAGVVGGALNAAGSFGSQLLGLGGGSGGGNAGMAANPAVGAAVNSTAFGTSNGIDSGAYTGSAGYDNGGAVSSNPYTALGQGIVGGLGDAVEAGLKAATMSKGGEVGGKAKVEGDSPENDTQPAMVSPGEIIVPRSATKNLKTAQAFLASVMKSKDDGDADHPLARLASLKAQTADLERHFGGGRI